MATAKVSYGLTDCRQNRSNRNAWHQVGKTVFSLERLRATPEVSYRLKYCAIYASPKDDPTRRKQSWLRVWAELCPVVD
jgi:hypothetical protein